LAPPVQPNISSEIFKRGLVPLFLLVYIAFNPGFPVHQTVPADDIPIDVPNLYVRKNHGKYHV